MDPLIPGILGFLFCQSLLVLQSDLAHPAVLLLLRDPSLLCTLVDRAGQLHPLHLQVLYLLLILEVPVALGIQGNLLVHCHLVVPWLHLDLVNHPYLVLQLLHLYLLDHVLHGDPGDP